MTLPEALALFVACTFSRPNRHAFDIKVSDCDWTQGEDAISEDLLDAALDVIRASAQQTARNHSNRDFGYG